VTRAELAEQFRALGLERGSRVLVHSSLRAVGPVEGGADAVVDALLDVAGEEGLLVFPAFTYDNPFFDGTEPARTGAVAEAARTREVAVRSLHPTYSVAAIGAGAAVLCSDHELRAGTDVDSPLDRLATAGGSVLLVGVGHVANTTVHVGEFHANAPYLEIPFSPAWPREHVIAMPDHESRRVRYDRFPGCSRSFGLVERGLRARGAVRDGMIGAALAQLVQGKAIIDETVELLEQDPAALLCTDPRCYRCNRARERLTPDRAAAAGSGG
jgi:aminoglycoside 3-N-acetyltransferase